MRVGLNDLYRERREPEVIEDQRGEVGASEIEVQPDRTTQDDPRMTEDILLDSLRVPSAHPGYGSIILPRVRDDDLCATCYEPILSHGAIHGRDWHAPKPMFDRTPGVHSDVDSRRARNAADQDDLVMTASGPVPVSR
jgi:hypothetical protein